MAEHDVFKETNYIDELKDVLQNFTNETRVLGKRMTKDDTRFKECLEKLITKAMVV